MKKLGNVLYILTEGSYIYCQNEAIAVKIGGEEKIRIPAHTIEFIVCLCNTTVSTPLIGFCGDRGIGLSFHSPTGQFYGRVNGKTSGNILLRKRQYELINTEYSVDIVRNILSGKFINSRNVLLKSARGMSDEKEVKLREAAEKISAQHKQLLEVDNIDSMRGIEGATATIYFSVFDDMLKTDDKNMMFEKRTKHPPENAVNAMLSFAYMLLKNEMQSALESVGLDIAAGYLHTLRPGRSSLALDLMEELRAPLCDRFVIAMVNLKQIRYEDFTIDSGVYNLNEKAKRKFIDSWQKRKKEEIIHPFIKEKIQIGLIPYCQAMLLARYIRGDIDQYPPFVWR